MRADARSRHAGRVRAGHPQAGAGSRPACLRSERHAGRLRAARSARQLGRLRRRFLPRHRCSHFQRSDQGQIRTAHGVRPHHRAAIRRDRRVVAQHDLTHFPGSQLRLDFAAVNFYDGQGFMVRKSLKVNSALELNGASVCVQQGTTTELNLADYFRSNNMTLKTVTFQTADEAVKAYDSSRCDSYTTDSSGLYGERLRLSDPGANIVLPEIISKEPLAPAVRQGDDNWEDI